MVRILAKMPRAGLRAPGKLRKGFVMATKFEVEEIHCDSCVKRITKAIHEVQPDARVQIDIPEGVVEIDEVADQAVIARAIEDAGYVVRGAA